MGEVEIVIDPILRSVAQLATKRWWR